MRVELSPVAEADKAVLANLLQLYRYDLSEFRGYEVSPHGTFVNHGRRPMDVVAEQDVPQPRPRITRR